jgi:hypothetical protein
MTPEQRAKAVDIYDGIFPGPSVRENVAKAIRSAENDILDVAANNVVAFLQGNQLGKVVADLIRMQKQPEPVDASWDD